jgi:beta-lactamase superfamily II metal-dependent hydrolase
MNFSQPKENEIEISLFGGGNGYGESLLIHVAKQKWILIDSALNPKTKRPIIDEYLTKIGTNYDHIVKIIATHWHDDHIKGLDTVYCESQNAKFYCSDALSGIEFYQLYTTYKDLDLPNNGLNEIAKLLKSIERNRDYHRTLKIDQLIMQEIVNNIGIQIHAISPTDYSILLSRQELLRLFPIEGESITGVKNPKPNRNCIVLMISFREENIILAADIEDENDDRLGWKGILDQSNVLPGKKFNIYKVAHHGSENGYNVNLWDNYLLNPISFLTSFVRGRVKIPTQSSIDQLKLNSKEVYITNCKSFESVKKRPFNQEKSIRYFKDDIYEYPFEYGHIRLRKTIDDSSSWKVDIDGTAIKY